MLFGDLLRCVFADWTINLYTWAILGVLISISGCWYRRLRKRGEVPFPPGPRGWPLIGYLWQLGDSPHLTLTAISRKYGDVFSVQLGGRPVVVLNGSELIGHVMSMRGAPLADRPSFETYRHYSGGASISFSSYDIALRQHRNMAFSAIRHLVDGSLMDDEAVLRRELTHLTDLWRSRTSGFDPSPDISITVSSFLYSFCFGERHLLRDDPEYVELLASENPTTQLFSAGSHVDFMPWLRSLTKRSQVRSATKRMRDFVMLNARQVARWKADGHNGSCIVGSLLTSWNDELRSPSEAGSLPRKRVENTTVEFMSAGSETSTASLLWLLLYMAKYPDSQGVVQRELDRVIGDQDLSVQDQQRLPYTEACILEVMRLIAIVPLGLPHTARRDVIVNGYVIPRGTVVLTNLWSAGRDRRVWSDADHFRPERFLRQSADGSTVVDRSLARKYYPFGAGSRRCVGEKLGRTQVFYAFAWILRHFYVMMDADAETALNEPLPVIFGDVMKPAKYHIRVKPRS